MKIDELGIEVLEIVNGEYPLIIFDKELFSKQFMIFYKAIDIKGYNKIIELMKDINNADELILKALFEDPELSISKMELDKLLRITRKDKMKKLKLI